MTTKSEKSMIYSVVVMWLALHVHLVTGQEWFFEVPSIQSIDIYNESAFNISWEYRRGETKPSFVQLSIAFNQLKSQKLYYKTSTMTGSARLNYTFETFFADKFFIPDEYYAVRLEYKANYNRSSSLLSEASGNGSYQLFKMGNTSIPNEEIETNVTDSSITVLLMWPKEIPYYSLHTNVLLGNQNSTLPVETVPNENYMIRKFRFENLSPLNRYDLRSMFEVSYVRDGEFIETRENTWKVQTSSPTTTARPTSGAEKLVFLNTVPLYLLNILVFYVLPSYHIL